MNPDEWQILVGIEAGIRRCGCDCIPTISLASGRVEITHDNTCPLLQSLQAGKN